MQMRDERLDFEASLDKRQDNDQAMKRELVKMEEKLSGKDQAINALS